MKLIQQLSGVAGRDMPTDRDAAALLALAVAIGLLFAGALTLFGGPLAASLKSIEADAPSQQIVHTPSPEK
ncbi:hypothetical protein [Stappia indica]|uniref:hypothetical protein n=1 Tax=Stappia indica TaxID=538381 RepID=UPI001CD48222|nr:hypothetical protein [Stappia indica]MCA1300662.1 hypothetical protein [Stappia indica]